MAEIQIIQSKLIPPMPSRNYIRRSTFMRAMDEAKDCRLVTLVAGPGFGKSLGLAQYIHDRSLNYSWYTVTEEDDGILPFLSYLEASLRRSHLLFRRSFTHVLGHGSMVEKRDLEQYLSLFINELCKMKEPFYLVIDDFHLVDHVYEINYVMNRLIQLLPGSIQLIVISRSNIPWANLLRLRINNQVREFHEEDLVFSDEEISLYLEDSYGLILTDEKVQDISLFTEGWAIAVHLVALQFSEGGFSFRYEKSPFIQNLFDYLSEEVFERWTVKEKEILLSLAIFPSFTDDLIVNFFGESTRDELYFLASELGFIQTFKGDGTFRYHALFRQFLKEKWLEIDPKRYKRLQRRASKYFYERKDYIEATYHAVKTKDPIFIARVLSYTASFLIRAGQFDWFMSIFNDLEEKIKIEFYSLYYYEGEVLRYQAYYERAKDSYHKCLTHAKKEGDPYYLSRSYEGFAHIFLDTIQPLLAESYLEKAIYWAHKSVHMKEGEINYLKRNFAENLVNAGRAKDAQAWVKQEELSADILREGNLDARMLLRMGRLYEAEFILKKRLSYEHSLPESHRETETVLALIYAMMGKASLAKDYAERSVMLGKQISSKFIESVGLTRLAHSKLLVPFSEMDKAEALYLKAIRMMDELNVSRVKAEPYMGLAIVQAKKGNFQEAIRYGESALRETEQVNDQWLSSLILISLGIIYFYLGDIIKAKKQIKKAEELLLSSGDVYGQMICQFWLMNIYYVEEDYFKLKELSKSFSKLCIQEKFVFFLKNRTMFGPFDLESIYPLFHKVFEIKTSEENLLFIKSELKLEKKKNHPGYSVYIKIFGGFQLHLGINEVEETQWKRIKAKEMLSYFLLHRTRWIAKEEIMTNLWHDASEETADRNFKVTMNALLNILEPKRRAHQPSFFILRRNNMYQLNPKAKFESDLQLYETYIEKGFLEKDEEVANLLFLNSFKLYKGGPLADIHNSDWIINLKKDLEHSHLQALEKTSQNYMELNDYYQVIEYAKEILRIDPTWEEAYRLIMQAYYKLRNRPQSIRWFERCVEVLNEQLDIDPMQKTKDLYKKILKDGE